jgi:hypothetical protein
MKIEQERKVTWELGDLREISPSSLIRDESDNVGRLVLRLALAFNDLKDTILLDVFRASFRALAPNEITPYSGQVGGIATHVHRFIGGILNEILNVINDERSATADAEFVTLLSSLTSPTQSLWKDLIAEAQNSPQASNSTVRAMLASLRNHSSFHYNGNRLRSSFRECFEGDQTATNRAAYYSAGVDMDGTRFYFADAAAQTDYKRAGKDRGRETDKEVAKLAKEINNALAMLINAFLKARGGVPIAT